MANGNKSEQAERIFFEHISFIYKTVILSVLILIIAVAAAIITQIWWIALVGALGLVPIYFKRKRRNRFIITNKRFIREQFNPHHNIIGAPLQNIVGVKSLSRASDKYGTVRIETTPEFGDQLLVDGEKEVGVIMCYKVPDHQTFGEIVTFAKDVAAKGP
jgi:hypothetical protein